MAVCIFLGDWGDVGVVKVGKGSVKIACLFGHWGVWFLRVGWGDWGWLLGYWVTVQGWGWGRLLGYRVVGRGQGWGLGSIFFEAGFGLG